MRELLFSVTLNDCDVQTFRGSGDGGQKKQKTSSGVRIIHKPSGAVGKATDTRSQHQNKRKAFIRLVESAEFKKWLKIKTAEVMHKPTPEMLVERAMRSENLRVECKDAEGAWVLFQAAETC